MGVRQPADDHFWGERNAVIGVFLEINFRFIQRIESIKVKLQNSNLGSIPRTLLIWASFNYPWLKTGATETHWFIGL